MANWQYRVDLKGIFHDEDKSFEERRDGIVKRLRESDWYKAYEAADDDSLKLYVDELSETQDGDDFDSVFGTIYDLADYDLAWIATSF